jgi:hypothetical protein
MRLATLTVIACLIDLTDPIPTPAGPHFFSTLPSQSALSAVEPEPDSIALLVTLFAGIGLWQLRKNLSKAKTSAAATELAEHPGRNMFTAVLMVKDRELATSNAKMSEAALICPKCGSASIRRSNSPGFVADLFEMFGRWPFRCRLCRKRFYRAFPPANRGWVCR